MGQVVSHGFFVFLWVSFKPFDIRKNCMIGWQQHVFTRVGMPSEFHKHASGGLLAQL